MAAATTRLAYILGPTDLSEERAFQKVCRQKTSHTKTFITTDRDWAVVEPCVKSNEQEQFISRNTFITEQG